MGQEVRTMAVCCDTNIDNNSFASKQLVFRYLKLFYYLTVMSVREEQYSVHIPYVLQHIRSQGELTQLDEMPHNGALLVTRWLEQLLLDLTLNGELDKRVLKLTHWHIEQMLLSFHGMHKIHTAPVPFPYRQLCAWSVTPTATAAPSPTPPHSWNRTEHCGGWSLGLPSHRSSPH